MQITGQAIVHTSARLHNRPGKQSSCQRRITDGLNTHCPGALPEDGHPIRIPAEGGDILFHPAQGGNLIQDPVVSGRLRGILQGQLRQGKKAKGAKPVIDGD